MRVDTRPRKRNAPRIAEKHCPAFLQWLRGRPCLFVGHGECDGKIEAMHLDFAGGKGVGTKVADRYSVPACSGHHRRQHNKGWITFLREVGMTKELLLGYAASFWSAWPGLFGWQRKQDAVAWERKLSGG